MVKLATSMPAVVFSTQVYCPSTSLVTVSGSRNSFSLTTNGEEAGSELKYHVSSDVIAAGIAEKNTEIAGRACTPAVKMRSGSQAIRVGLPKQEREFIEYQVSVRFHYSQLFIHRCSSPDGWCVNVSVATCACL